MYMKPMLRTIATVLAIFLLSDCVKQEQDSESGTGFSLGQTSVEVPAEGGEVTVAYVLEDPVEGLEVIPKITVDWVHDFDMSDAGRVKFTVDPTDVEVYDRETVLTLTYGEEARDLKIVQKGAEASIEFVVEQARHYSFIVRIVPKDPDMRCFVTAVEKETADSYVLDEEIFAADAEHFREHAELYGLTLEQYFNQMYSTSWFFTPPYSYVQLNSVYGMTDNWFDAGKDYCVYCYGIDEQGKPLTQVYRQYVSTMPLSLDSQLNLDMTVEVDGQSVLLSVNPSDASSLYYYGAMLADDKSEEELLYEVQSNIDRSIFMAYSYPETVYSGGVDWKELVRTVAQTGPAERSIDFEVADRNGMAFAYAIDDMGNIISAGTVKSFKTDNVDRSDNEITLTISDIDFRSAYVDVATTNSDPWQLCIAQDDGGFEGLSSEELIERIWDKGRIAYDIGHGNARLPLGNLTESTAYIVVAYGWDKGRVTTDAVTSSFSTSVQEISEAVCEPYVYKYFSSLEMAERYPEEYGEYAGYAESAIVQVRAEVSGASEWYLYHIMPSATVSAMSDEQLLGVVENLYNTVGACGPYKIFSMKLDAPLTLFGVAMGSDGNYGPVFRKEYTFTKEGMSPIDEFVLE